LDPYDVARWTGGKDSARLWTAASASALATLLAAPASGSPRVVTGGADLLRAALQRARAGERVEVFGTYRLTDGSVRWWFQRVCGVEFPNEEHYQLLHQRSGGIPVLVGAIDTRLLPSGPHAGGYNPDHAAFKALLQEFDRELNTSTFGLDGNDPTRALTPRERDLVRMIHVTSAALGDNQPIRFREWLIDEWVRADFGATWDALYPGNPFPSPYLSGADDAIAVETLVLLGILRARDGVDPLDRVGPLKSNDPVVTIWRQLG
jgi:hypothetical protein